VIRNDDHGLDAAPPHQPLLDPNQHGPADHQDDSRQRSDRIPQSAPPTKAYLSRLLRDEGIARANENADSWWRSCADAAIDYLAALGRPFSGDGVQRLIPSPDSPCRMGARFHVAIRAGVIRPVGYTLSCRPSRHRGVLRLYAPADAEPTTAVRAAAS